MKVGLVRTADFGWYIVFGMGNGQRRRPRKERAKDKQEALTRRQVRRIMGVAGEQFGKMPNKTRHYFGIDVAHRGNQ